ncbi:MAG: type II toxin-antitoxin system RelE/ParE family toxin [Gemmatimonadetes bacterium]|jgi:toxin ParE1/3/4|nr:type II toxin-antitoxin system RelE/ParE family toxin [Gemmatimonadota bacterium]
MPYEVLLTAGAQRDLEAIYDYIAEADGQARADHVLDQLLDVSERLAEFPERGAYPKELLALGIREYRQLFFQPYRVIYRVIDQQVFITLIADGRRDMQALLARRLLEE